MVQPDLGTAMMVLMGGGALLFVAGVRLWMFLGAGVGGGRPACRSPGRSCTNTSASACSPSSIPTAIRWAPATTSPSPRSPSARAACSARASCKGTQSSLNFLPEKQTDFIFTTFVEEWGMVGACVLLGLFALVLVWGFSIALRSQHHFGRLLALGVTAMMFLYVFINTAMVMGLLPVVGVPLPLVSNGGTAMVSVMFACGLLIGVNVYRDAQLPRTR